VHADEQLARTRIANFRVGCFQYVGTTRTGDPHCTHFHRKNKRESKAADTMATNMMM
jgi:hypothetical protein